MPVPLPVDIAGDVIALAEILAVIAATSHHEGNTTPAPVDPAE